jgi:lipid-binding SYLF domain-containing protein
MAALSLSALPAFAQDGAPAREDARLVTSTEVLNMLRATPDQNIPAWLMQRAYGVAVIPDVLKGAFLFGGRYGNGALTVRNAQGRFSDPIFITLAGGSVGWQIGATSTDVVLVFVTQRSVQNFARGKFTLGVDASVAAGPLGRQGEAAAGVNAEIYSYSRSRGLFAGVALDGTVLAFDRGANRAFYGDRPVTTDMITSGQVTTTDESARRFLQAVVADTGNSAAPEPTQAASTPSTPPPQAAPSPSGQSGTHTYPLQDSHPGAEPQPQ